VAFQQQYNSSPAWHLLLAHLAHESVAAAVALLLTHRPCWAHCILTGLRYPSGLQRTWAGISIDQQQMQLMVQAQSVTDAAFEISSNATPIQLPLCAIHIAEYHQQRLQ
jgi:hypothetical protein